MSEDRAVRRFAGVLAYHGDMVVLVRERYPTWDAEHWNVPSGRVESGESEVDGAVRELREETGLQVEPGEVGLVSTVTVVDDQGVVRSRSSNYSVGLADPDQDALVADPDGDVQEARWFTRAEAVDLLSGLPYPPIAVPAVHYLTGCAEPGTWWIFTLPPDDSVEPSDWTWEVAVDPTTRLH